MPMIDDKGMASFKEVLEFYVKNTPEKGIRQVNEICAMPQEDQVRLISFQLYHLTVTMNRLSGMIAALLAGTILTEENEESEPDDRPNA